MLCNITLIPGDGVGPEITEATVRALEATGVVIKWDIRQIGEAALKKYGTPLPNEVLRSIRKNKVALKGPVGTPVGGVRIVPLTSGALSNCIYLDFPTVSNQTYTVEYSLDPSFANGVVALPVVTATANFSLWIDYGPPATLSHPSNAPARFYRVFLNP